jgi:hypothetical protein
MQSGIMQSGLMQSGDFIAQSFANGAAGRPSSSASTCRMIATREYVQFSIGGVCRRAIASRPGDSFSALRDWHHTIGSRGAYAHDLGGSHISSRI